MTTLILQVNAIADKKHFSISENQIIRIGSHSKNEIILSIKITEDNSNKQNTSKSVEFISRFHAEIRRKQTISGDECFLSDGSLKTNKPSTNGTFLNGTRIGSKRSYSLKDGDIITFTRQEYPRIIFTKEPPSESNLNGTSSYEREEDSNKDYS